MTDKELHKLGRRELLQLMLAQGREAEKAKKELAETLEKLNKVEEGYERLRRRLDDKDAQIHKLREALKAERQGRPAPEVEPLPAVDDHFVPPAAAAPKPQPPASVPKRKAEVLSPQVPRTPAPRAAAHHGPRHARSADNMQVLEVVQIVKGKMQPGSQLLVRKQAN